MEKIIIYYAVNKSGQGCVFMDCPVREEHFGVWMGEHIGAVSSFFMFLESEGFTLPRMSWADEPHKITLSISI